VRKLTPDPFIESTEKTEGMPVLGCIPGSAAAASGFRVGDVILEVNGQQISGVDAYVQARQRDPHVMSVRLRRGTDTIQLLVQLTAAGAPAINVRGVFST
jgi:S1-C subfamily serine protease